MIRPTHALIDREALRSNIRLLRRRLEPEARLMAVVKANCYGHGVEHCVPLMREEGVDIFGVATAEEGIGLREFGVTERVVVLPPPLRGQVGIYVRHDLEALLSEAPIADELAAAAAAAGRVLRAHLHIDTGMTRNGIDPAGAVDLMRRLSAHRSLEIVGVASHFATSDEVDGEFARVQQERFDGAIAALADAGFRFAETHLSNSGGVLNLRRAQYTMVRPGLALYGYHPTQERQSASGLVPVMSVVTAVGGVKRIEAGVPVSYGRIWSAPRATTIATLPIGYADGLMRALSGRLDVLIGGRRYPAVGRISMDETMIDLGPDSAVEPGDPVVIIGRSATESITAWDLAEAAGTIPYEICTNLSSRVPRRSAGADEPSTFTSTK
jgi:alanine racemase